MNIDEPSNNLEKPEEAEVPNIGNQEIPMDGSNLSHRKQTVLTGVIIVILLVGLVSVITWASIRKDKPPAVEQPAASQEVQTVVETVPEEKPQPGAGLKQLAGAGTATDQQTSIVYFADTGEVQIDAPSSRELTSIIIESESGIFNPATTENIEGGLDAVTRQSIFKATFTGSFGSSSFGRAAPAGLTETFIYQDLRVTGSLAGGGDLGNIDLIYVPEGEDGPAELAQAIEVDQDQANLLAEEKAATVMRRIVADNGDRRVEWNNYTRDNILQAFKTNALPDPNNWAMCAVQFNHDAPDEWIEHPDESHGVMWQIPYNHKWGNDAISVPPVSTASSRQDKLIFGPMTAIFEGGCGWGQYLTIQYKSPQSAGDVIQELENRWGELIEPVMKKIGQREVVTYTSAGLCDSYHMEITGDTYNYQLSASCSGLDNETELLEEMARRAGFHATGQDH